MGIKQTEVSQRRGTNTEWSLSYVGDWKVERSRHFGRGRGIEILYYETLSVTELQPWCFKFKKLFFLVYSYAAVLENYEILEDQDTNLGWSCARQETYRLYYFFQP